jgi:hypothetical protein
MHDQEHVLRRVPKLRLGHAKAPEIAPHEGKLCLVHLFEGLPLGPALGRECGERGFDHRGDGPDERRSHEQKKPTG